MLSQRGSIEIEIELTAALRLVNGKNNSMLFDILSAQKYMKYEQKSTHT